jgi:hypothetical protein
MKLSNIDIFINLPTMKERIIQKLAHGISTVFSPLVVPTLGVWIVMNYIPSAEYYSFKLKFVLLAIVVCSSCFIPLLYLILSNLNRKFFKDNVNNSSRMLYYLFSCLSVFMGAQLLGKLPITGIFKFLLLGTCFILVIDLLVSIKWNISEHTSILGGLWGTLIALNFRYGANVIVAILLLSIIAGIVGSAKLYLSHHTPSQVYSGFVLGAVCMFAFLIFI